MINWENYEEYMIMLADAELSPAETEELKAFVRGNKELEQELAYYEAIRMIPDAREVFAGKEKLLKKAGGGRFIGLQRNWAYGIAAGIFLLIFLGIFRWERTNMATEASVTSDTINKAPILNMVAPNTPHKSEPSMPLAEQTDHKVITSKTAKNSVKKPVKIKNESGTKEETVQYAHNGPEKTDSVLYEKASKPEKEPIAENPVREIQAPTISIIPEDSISAIVKPKKNFLARLPFVGKKNVGINLMTDALASKVKKAKRIKDKLKDTDIVIKLGDKEVLAFNL